MRPAANVATLSLLLSCVAATARNSTAAADKLGVIRRVADAAADAAHLLEQRFRVPFNNNSGMARVCARYHNRKSSRVAAGSEIGELRRASRVISNEQT